MVRLRLETDLGSSIKLITDAAGAVEKVGTKFTESARAAKSLELAAKRIVDQNLTPQEKYNQKVELLSKAFVQGKIKVEDMDRTLARLRQRMDETGSSQQKAFGSNAIKNIADYATGIFGVAAAIRTVTAAMQDQRQKSIEAAAGLAASFEGAAGLQLEALDQADFERLRAFSEGLISRGIVEKPGPEGGITAGLRKAGLTSAEMEQVAQLGQDDLLAASQLVQFARGAKGAQRIFGLQTFEQAGAMLIEGARGSKVTPGELGEMTLRFGEGARKMPFAEALATSLAILETSKTERQVATALEKVVAGDRQLSPGEKAARDAHLRRFQQPIGFAELPRFAEADRDLAAEDTRQESTGRLTTSRRARGRREALFQSLRAEEQKVAENQNFFMRWMDWLGGKVTEQFPQMAIEHAAGQQPEYLSPKLLDEINKELKNQTREIKQEKAPRPAGRQEN